LEVFNYWILRIADYRLRIGGLKIADCGLRIADYKLGIVDCRLRIGDWGLWIADCSAVADCRLLRRGELAFGRGIKLKVFLSPDELECCQN
jgi:hypothetical protein